ncbi:MAG: hypothetical protein R2704_07325 [Microthrixaceae bacterium]
MGVAAALVVSGCTDNDQGRGAEGAEGRVIGTGETYSASITRT